jgi:general stress protein YciG
MNKGITVSEAGRKGGKARAAKLSKARRIEIARQGYHASPLSDKHKQCQSVQNGENKDLNTSCA